MVWCGWCGESGAVGVVQWEWCGLCGAVRVVRLVWCSKSGAVRVVQWEWCSENEAVRVVQWEWCSESGAVRVVQWEWCSEIGAVRVVQGGWLVPKSGSCVGGLLYSPRHYYSPRPSLVLADVHERYTVRIDYRTTSVGQQLSVQNSRINFVCAQTCRRICVCIKKSVYLFMS